MLLLFGVCSAQEIPVQLEKALTASNVRELSRQFDEREMSLVQIAHCRNECNVIAVAAPVRNLLGELCLGMND